MNTVPSNKPIVRVAPDGIDLEPCGIPSEWILSGTRGAWNKEVARSYDRVAQIVVWECTGGHFKWHYSKDESVIVILGEAFRHCEHALFATASTGAIYEQVVHTDVFAHAIKPRIISQDGGCRLRYNWLGNQSE